jgi:hypothetical protein
MPIDEMTNDSLPRKWYHWSDGFTMPNSSKSAANYIVKSHQNRIQNGVLALAAERFEDVSRALY